MRPPPFSAVCNRSSDRDGGGVGGGGLQTFDRRLAADFMFCSSIVSAVRVRPSFRPSVRPSSHLAKASVWLHFGTRRHRRRRSRRLLFARTIQDRTERERERESERETHRQSGREGGDSCAAPLFVRQGDFNIGFSENFRSDGSNKPSDSRNSPLRMTKSSRTPALLCSSPCRSSALHPVAPLSVRASVRQAYLLLFPSTRRGRRRRRRRRTTTTTTTGGVGPNQLRPRPPPPRPLLFLLLLLLLLLLLRGLQRADDSLSLH